MRNSMKSTPISVGRVQSSTKYKILLEMVLTFLTLTILSLKGVYGQHVVNNRPINPDKCTTIALGNKATVDGSTIGTHGADCAECDWRINKVEAKDWPEGSMRPIYLLSGAYPRQVREDRGLTWSVKNLENYPEFRSEWEGMTGEIIGHIPQVAHTNALIEGMYGYMNEYQVGIGESTCPAKMWASPVGSSGGMALLEISELSQIGLERGKTARETVQIMGDLAVQYGFYSAVWDEAAGVDMLLGEAGEALSVVDPQEAWIFHILPDNTGSSAVWVAQRVPDDHATIVANMFTIRHVDPKNNKDFLFSANLWSVAESQGWWKASDGLLDFKMVYSPERYLPDYSNRRVWRLLTLAAPSLQLAFKTDPMATNYPFSVKVDRKWAVEDVMAAHRDHYQGTPYDMEVGVAAGPFGDPNRFDVSANGNMTFRDADQGEFPRSIALFRTTYTTIAQPRAGVPNDLALLWVAQYNADVSTFTPLYVASTDMPTSWMRGTMHRYTPESAWWNFCAVGNYAARFYRYAMVPVRALQTRLEAQLKKEVANLEAGMLVLLKKIEKEDSVESAEEVDGEGQVQRARERVLTTLTAFTVSRGEMISREWASLFPVILTTFRDGFRIDSSQAMIGINRLFYPRWWLEKVGYFDMTPNNKTGAILMAPNPTFIESKTVSYTSFVATVMICTIMTGMLSLWLGFRSAKTSMTDNINGDPNDSVVHVPNSKFYTFQAPSGQRNSYSNLA